MHTPHSDGSAVLDPQTRQRAAESFLEAATLFVSPRTRRIASSLLRQSGAEERLERILAEIDGMGNCAIADLIYEMVQPHDPVLRASRLFSSACERLGIVQWYRIFHADFNELSWPATHALYEWLGLLGGEEDIAAYLRRNFPRLMEATLYDSLFYENGGVHPDEEDGEEDFLASASAWSSSESEEGREEAPVYDHAYATALTERFESVVERDEFCGAALARFGFFSSDVKDFRMIRLTREVTSAPEPEQVARLCSILGSWQGAAGEALSDLHASLSPDAWAALSERLLSLTPEQLGSLYQDVDLAPSRALSILLA